MNKAITQAEREGADAFHAPVEITGAAPTSIMDVISRAATDPSVDIGKLERLMDLAERVHAREAKAAYYAALSEMQTQLPVIAERGEIKIGSGNGQRYALWEDINKAIKPVLKAHGFALSFRTGLTDGKVTVTGVLSHSAGHAEETTIHLPSDTSGSKNAVQAVGSSTSYGKRYTASALLNLTSSGEDDDGRGAGAETPVTEEQLTWLRDNLERTHSNIEVFCQYFKIQALPEMKQRDYPRAVEMLNHKARPKSAKAASAQ